jgi:hypothetical protein
MPAKRRRAEPITVHLFPAAEGWKLVVGDAEKPETEAREFPNLGLALDAAVADTHEVRVVVHDGAA